MGFNSGFKGLMNKNASQVQYYVVADRWKEHMRTLCNCQTSFWNVKRLSTA